MSTMRDAFFDRLFPRAKDDPSIMVLTSDFSAPSFDRYRTDLPGQFINTGISEQNTILVASGLAMAGQTVFVVSLAPFITMRCFEQIRLYPADMKLNVAIVGVGAGFSYVESGATHHSIEDLGLMSLLPNMRVLAPSSNSQVRAGVDHILDRPGPWYVRLDRHSLPEMYEGEEDGRGSTLAVLKPGGRVRLLATGATVAPALAMALSLHEAGLEVGVVDAFEFPLDLNEFSRHFTGAELIVSLEEHVASGGLGEAAGRALESLELPVRLKRFALDTSRGLCHSYGPREALWRRHGLDLEAAKDFIKAYEAGGR